VPIPENEKSPITVISRNWEKMGVNIRVEISFHYVVFDVLPH